MVLSRRGRDVLCGVRTYLWDVDAVGKEGGNTSYQLWMLGKGVWRTDAGEGWISGLGHRVWPMSAFGTGSSMWAALLVKTRLVKTRFGGSRTRMLALIPIDV
jgi:hypothetical protein